MTTIAGHQQQMRSTALHGSFPPEVQASDLRLQKVTAGYTLRPAPLDIVADCKAVITALTARVHIAINLLSYRTVSCKAAGRVLSPRAVCVPAALQVLQALQALVPAE